MTFSFPPSVKGLTRLWNLFKVNKNIKTIALAWKHWWLSDAFIVNFEQIPLLFLVFHSWIWESVAGWFYQRRSKGKDLNIMKQARAGAKLCNISLTGQTATWNKTCIEFKRYAEKDFEQLPMKCIAIFVS